MPVTKLVVEYFGTPFAGWAKQPGERTVEEEIERAIKTISGETVQMSVAGRTDKGVHAWSQVASYSGEPINTRALNAVLPDEISIISSDFAAHGFDARRDATSRAYCYKLLLRKERSPFLDGYALHWPKPCDVELLEACAAMIVGEHDFTAFTPTDTAHVRFERVMFSAEWKQLDGELLEFWIEGDSFMRHMVRALVGTMLDVARGWLTLEQFAALLEGARREEAGKTAAAHGLYFAGVSFTGARLLPQLADVAGA